MTETIPLIKGKAFLKGEWIECNFIKLPSNGLPVINLCYDTWGELLDHKHLMGRENIELEEPEEVKATCPKCYYTKLAYYSSLQYKQCTKCGFKIPWELKEKQLPLVKHQR